MAPETAEAPAAPAAPAEPGVLRIRLRRAKRPGQGQPKGAIAKGDTETARERGKLGGRPSQLSIRKAFPEMFDFAKKVWTDPEVQSTILDLARAGLLHPTLQRELLYVYNGRPAYKMQVTREADPDEDEKRERMRAMPREERRVLMDLLRKANAPRALPAPGGAAAPVRRDRVASQRISG